MQSVLVTHSTLVRDLRDAGVQSGDKILVHSSLGSLGFVAGAARTVVEAVAFSKRVAQSIEDYIDTLPAKEKAS